MIMEGKERKKKKEINVEKTSSLWELELHDIPCAKPMTGVKVTVCMVNTSSRFTNSRSL